jgi:protein-tyrosine-phosphatase
MAEGLLRTHLATAGIPAQVGSAGLMPGGSPATEHAVAVTATRGVDISDHVSRQLDRQVVRSAPLIIGMARTHVREAVVTYGAPIERTFTLKELVRRGEKVGPRRATEPVSAWLARVGVGRQVSDLIGDDPDDDVADPIGRPLQEYAITVAELDDLITRFVGLLVGSGAQED